MGHARLPPLPMTRKWREVVAIIGCEASVKQVAATTLKACEKELGYAADDPGVVEAVWLLMRLPLAARGDDFARELFHLGIDVPAAPGLPELIAGVTEAIDRALFNSCKRTDLGELAQTAATETLAEYVGGRLGGLFAASAEEVQGELARLDTAVQFGRFAKEYFTRFTFKVIDYFLNRTLPEQTGEGKRFTTFRHQQQFTDALETHCRETAEIVTTYAGDWLKLHEWGTKGDIEREQAGKFISYAMSKLTSELRRRNVADGR
jgi:hypothetical protein